MKDVRKGGRRVSGIVKSMTFVKSSIARLVSVCLVSIRLVFNSKYTIRLIYE